VTLDPQTAALLSEITPPPEALHLGLRGVGPQMARVASRTVFLGYAGRDPSPCSTEDVLIEGAARPVPARLYRPIGNDSRTPLVVFLHGGGWAMGDLDCYDGLMRDLCAHSGAMLLSVDYLLAPESKFPAALNEGLAAVRWAAGFIGAQADDGPRLAVMGDSAGGNLAAVIARRLHVEGLIRLSAQFLLYPVLDVSRPHAAYASRIKYGDGNYLLTRESIDTTTAWYLNDTDMPDNPDVSPLLAANAGILPETIIVAAGHDPLLDESRIYAGMLAAAGVPTRLKCFETTIHAFLSLGVLDVAQQGRRYLATEIKRCLLP
jgi:acetyl esterase